MIYDAKVVYLKKIGMKELIIAFVGSGRVVETLAPAFFHAGLNVRYILSRNIASAGSIASNAGAEASASMVIPTDTSLVIIAVPDDSINEVAAGLKFEGNPVFVHTSGGTTMDVFPANITKRGVIYPLQTFTRGREIDLRDIHIFTEASDATTGEIIDTVAASITPNVHHLVSSERQALHLSAVFVSNFVNHMLRSGFETASHWGIDPDVFIPLINETVSKAIEIGPRAAQTGPAARKDKRVIAKHIELLSFSDDLKNLYKVVTESIIARTTKTKEENDE
jgi:predicted short-subunit dehydrogenase-like oxidoreductase (DUF2520 family)